MRSATQRWLSALGTLGALSTLGTLSTIALLSAAGQPGQPAAEQPAYLRLRAAEINDFARPADASSDSARQPIVFRIESDGAPICGGSDPRPSRPSYAFLIDADKSQKTGTVTRAFPELGIDLQVEMHCDAARGTFVSQAGDVVVRPAATAEDPYVVEVAVAREALPSLDFYWIAIVRDGKRLARLPEPGRYEAWRPLEQWLH